MCGSILSLRYNVIERGLRASALDEETCYLGFPIALGIAFYLYSIVSIIMGTLTLKELSIISCL